MRTFFTSFILFIVLCSFINTYKFPLNLTPFKNDLEIENIKGKVKSTTENVYTSVEKFGQYQRNKFSSRNVSNYNIQGYLIGFARYSEDGSTSLKGEVIYKYDSQKNIIEQYRKYEDGTIVNQHSYKYNSKGLKIERYDHGYQKKIVSKIIYVYDSENNIIEEKKYKEGDLQSNIIYKYDGKNNLILKKMLKNNKLVSETNYKYNSDYNLIEEIELSPIGNSQYKSTYKYSVFDKKGNWTKRISIYAFPELEIYIVERSILYY